MKREKSKNIIEHTPEIPLKLKLGHIAVNGLLADFGDAVHIAKLNGKYVTIIESDTVSFEKSVSPIEFLKPDELEDVLEKIRKKGNME